MSSKTKVYELAKELGIDNQQLLEMAQRLGIDAKNSMSVIGSEEVKTIRDHSRQNKALSATKPAARGVVTEKRVGARVIRRRAKPGAAAATETPAEEPKASTEAPQSEAPKKSAAAPKEEKTATAAEKKAPKKAGKPAPIVKTFKLEKPAPKEAKPAATMEGAEEEVKKTTEPAASASAETVKKRRLPPSIVKRVKTEEHLEKNFGPKQEKKKRPETAATDPSKELRRVKEVEVSAVPQVVDPNKDAGRRRLMNRQNTVFRSADYLKRELVHTRRKKGAGQRSGQKTQITIPAEHKRVVEMGEAISVAELAKELGIKVGFLMKKLIEMGVQATINESLDFDTASLVAQEFNHEVKQAVFKEEDFIPALDMDEDKMKSRPPVVTIMGHVDHGKTSLLDTIRKSRVAEGESGGITQHIGAYTVTVPKKGSISFVDTPGHEAFTEMRARGAQVTDIVVLVVSATEGPMPQTLESIDHAKAAKVPIVVAVNKCDLPDANPDKTKQQMAAHDLAPEEWGGDTIFVNVSAKNGDGIDELLENILLQSEMLELKANPSASPRGVVVESRLDKHRGSIATVLVQQGMLKPGQILVAGTAFGKIRALSDSLGKKVKEAGPSTPVEVLGLPEAAPVGEMVFVVPDERTARTITSQRADIKRRNASVAKPKMTLEEMLAGEGDQKELRLILKCDVQGSAEAIKAAIEKLPVDKVKVRILSTAIGGITENDVNLAVASKAVVLGFNVRPDTKASRHAESEGVEVHTYSVIYELMDAIKALMEGMLDALIKEEVIGRAQIRNVFNIPKIGAIAGSSVTDGKVVRGCWLRVLRDSKVIYEGKISSLRRFKDDVKEVASGYECGIGLENFNDLKLGDEFEAFLKVEEKATL